MRATTITGYWDGKAVAHDQFFMKLMEITKEVANKFPAFKKFTTHLIL
jgi:hypothetical protein